MTPLGAAIQKAPQELAGADGRRKPPKQCKVFCPACDFALYGSRHQVARGLPICNATDCPTHPQMLPALLSDCADFCPERIAEHPLYAWSEAQHDRALQRGPAKPRRRADGTCADCGEPAPAGKQRCDACTYVDDGRGNLKRRNIGGMAPAAGVYRCSGITSGQRCSDKTVKPGGLCPACHAAAVNAGTIKATPPAAPAVKLAALLPMTRAERHDAAMRRLAETDIPF